jgi:hypothetical protein
MVEQSSRSCFGGCKAAISVAENRLHLESTGVGV